ncbi:hypothetical protein I6E50_09245 [Roseburia hominis]|uniref:hypothetical protein n=1 Tax=Roseburia hominis TaxID=301301 RepID=UPI001F2E999C|nr:hypothetical protein [Roseburia hominis]
MDKYEYRLKLDEMKSLAGEGNYEKAEEIADTINWKKVKNVNSLVLASEIYSNRERYEDSRDVLLMAYDRSPIGRMIIYRLAELAIRTHNFDEAKDYYDEFVEIAPHDNLKYVLRYKMSREQGENIAEQIKILEELKEQEYTEKWAYELAHLYHEAGMSDKCIDACDELVLWFGDGTYVEKALELKMLYQPLTSQQEEKYLTFQREESEREGIVKVYRDEDLASGEIVSETVQIPKVTMNTGIFNTVNLQEELAKSMQQIMDATEKETVSDTMDNIKKMVEDIPYLKMPEPEGDKKETGKYGHIETDEEIDGSLKINFKELLEEDKDGQMSLNVPEQAMIERQITGQMSISDVLEEWEKTKRAAETALQEAEQRRLESAKARALKETEEIMERLKDVVPQLENDFTSNKKELENEYKNQENGGEAAGKIVANMNQILQQQIDKLSRSTEDLDEILKQKKEETKESREQRLARKMVQPTKRIPSLEAFMKRTFFREDDLLEDDAEDEFEEEPVVEDLNLEEEPEETEVPVVEENTTQEEYVDEASEYDDDKVYDGEIEYHEADDEYADGADYEEDEIEYADDEEYEDEYDEEEAYEEDEIEYADDEEYKAEYDEEEMDYGEDEPESSDTPEELSQEEEELFSYFMPVNGMKEQISEALSGAAKHLDENAGFGHIMIQGIHGNGKTVLATSLVKVLQKRTGRPNGRIGKIEGKSLNEKDIAMLFRKIAGGCLIVEKAGDISRETAVRMGLCLETDESDILIILEDTKEGLKKALGRDEKFAKKFTEKIEIPIFTSDELVAFAKAYANESGYDIDDMATLALYNRISNIQRLDEPTNLIEVKEIVDEAIARAEKGGLKKIFSILTSRRYTEDDYIALREKDFDE